MQKDRMGNQNTSGILEEKVQEVSSPGDKKEENQTLIQEAETKDFQEKAAGSDSNDAEADKSSPFEGLTSCEKEVANRSVDVDYEARTAASHDVSSNHVELKESDLEEETSKFYNEVDDSKGVIQSSDLNFIQKSTSNITNLDSLPHEAVDISSEPQEDHNTKEIVENIGLVNSCQIEEGITSASDIDDDDNVVTNKDDLVAASIASAEGELLEKYTHKEEFVTKNTADNIENGIKNKRSDGDPPQDEQNSSSTSLNILPTISLQDLSNGEGKVLLVDGDKEKDEINQIDQTNSLKSIASEELKDADEVTETAKEIGLVQTADLVPMAENEEEDDQKEESTPEKVVLRKGDSFVTGNNYEVETSTMEKQESQTKSSLEIELGTESELGQNPRALSSSGFESNPSYTCVQVELRKSPSFEFGLPFDARPEESDQTPLLYQDRPPMRSFSSCSALRFQNRSVQTEYFGKSLQHEAVEVEEKTIRMERSNSESSRPMLLLPKEKANVVVAKAKQETSASDEKQENDLKTSPSREDCVIISPKGNDKRKPKSSLFTTCICCTTAIS